MKNIANKHTCTSQYSSSIKFYYFTTLIILLATTKSCSSTSTYTQTTLTTVKPNNVDVIQTNHARIRNRNLLEGRRRSFRSSDIDSNSSTNIASFHVDSHSSSRKLSLWSVILRKCRSPWICLFVCYLFFVCLLFVCLFDSLFDFKIAHDYF